jgi:hypothetical protein
MSILAAVQRHRAERTARLRATAMGADLIPRAGVDDSRYAGVDLVARGRDVEKVRIGTARLSLTPEDLGPELRATAERIAAELRAAGVEEIGRWATDVVYAYGEMPDLPEPVQVAVYHAWALDLAATTTSRSIRDSPSAVA